VIVGDLHVTYKEFQESMKKYCDISETLMAVYCEVFNGRPEKYLFDKDNRKKISFSPFFTVCCSFCALVSFFLCFISS
jgi:hypothetical protein